MTNLISLNKISKDYYQGRSCINILKEIDFSISAGEIVSIIGASGSGKSTLLHIAGLIDSPSSGSINMFGIKNISSEKEKTQIRLSKLGFIYQNHYLLTEFNVRENVAIPKMLLEGKKEEALDEADELLDKLGLAKRTFNFPGDLSGGEQQRVAIARAIINKPKLLLADEPTGNLDPENAKLVFNLIIKLINEYNMGAIIVTHNHELANLTNITYRLNQGILHKIDR